MRGMMVAAAAMGAFLCNVAMAQPGGPNNEGRRGRVDPDRMFERLDKNQDGKVTKNEMPAPLAQRLLRADGNEDGALTKEEFAGAFSRGERSPGEGRRGGFPSPEERFKEMDKDGDGKLTMEEYITGQQALMEQMRERARGFRGRGGFDAKSIFERIDEDGDGVLQGNEISERMKERMEDIDTDKDGKITSEEFQASWERRMEEFRNRRGQRGNRGDSERDRE